MQEIQYVRVPVRPSCVVPEGISPYARPVGASRRPVHLELTSRLRSESFELLAIICLFCGVSRLRSTSVSRWCKGGCN